MEVLPEAGGAGHLRASEQCHLLYAKGFPAAMSTADRSSLSRGCRGPCSPSERWIALDVDPTSTIGRQHPGSIGDERYGATMETTAERGLQSGSDSTIQLMTREDPVDHDCPDCGVPMEAASVSAAGAAGLYVTTDRDRGVLGRLGIGESVRIDPVLCPECGLIRLYADI